MYKKILVPLEGTENDEVILEHVRHLAKNVGAAVVLIQLHRVIKDDDPFIKGIQTEPGSLGYSKKEKAYTVEEIPEKSIEKAIPKMYKLIEKEIGEDALKISNIKSDKAISC